jgi:hypothetical protein
VYDICGFVLCQGNLPIFLAKVEKGTKNLATEDTESTEKRKIRHGLTRIDTVIKKGRD